MNALLQSLAAPQQADAAVFADTVSLPTLHFEAGLPQDRHARIAARRAFVDIKQRFMDAAALVDSPRGNWLRYQVRQAHEMTDLWLLRGAVFSALKAEGRTTERTQNELQDALDSVFPNAGELLPYGVR